MATEIDEDVEHDEPLLIEGVFTKIQHATMKPPQWVVTNLLPVGLTFLAAPPKTQKSTLTMALAALIAEHECSALPRFMSNVERPGGVLVLSAEATAGELRYMMQPPDSNEGFTVPVDLDEETGWDILISDDPWEFRLDDDDAQDRLLEWLTKLDPRLLIIDPLRRFHQGDENDSGEMSRMLRPIRRWLVQHEAAGIIVHHTSKPGQDKAGPYTAMDMRGTGDLLGMADAAITMSPLGRDGAQRQVIAQFKRGKAWESVVTFGTYGLKASENLDDIDEQVLKALRAGAKTYDDIAKALHVGKKRVVESMTRLKRNGLVKGK